MAILKPTKVATACILLAALLQPLVAAEPPPPAEGDREYALKAVFLYNFCRFIEWPKSAFASPTSPIVIGVFGQDPFGPLLKEAVQGETHQGRPIQIEYYRKADAIGKCHLLFVSRSEAAKLDAILAAVAGKSIVTVGETDAFLDRGGMIALTAAQNRVRLHMNPAIMRAARLDVSSKLLRIADVKP